VDDAPVPSSRLETEPADLEQQFDDGIAPRAFGQAQRRSKIRQAEFGSAEKNDGLFEGLAARFVPICDRRSIQIDGVEVYADAGKPTLTSPRHTVTAAQKDC
jgi:hypothetical protein